MQEKVILQLFPCTIKSIWNVGKAFGITQSTMPGIIINLALNLLKKFISICGLVVLPLVVVAGITDSVFI